VTVLAKHNRATYVNYGCRCEVCKQANRAYLHDRRIRKEIARQSEPFSLVEYLLHDLGDEDE
jgi:queuine/archaeosine tRNA-ribosyltransferase